MSLLPYEKKNCTIVYVVTGDNKKNTTSSSSSSPKIAFLHTCRYELEKRSPFWRTFINDHIRTSTTLSNVNILFDIACGIPAPVIQLYISQINTTTTDTTSSSSTNHLKQPLQLQQQCLQQYAFTHLFTHFDAYLKFICFLQDFTALHVLFSFLQQFLTLHPEAQSGTYDFLWKMYQCVCAHQFFRSQPTL